MCVCSFCVFCVCVCLYKHTHTQSTQTRFSSTQQFKEYFVCALCVCVCDLCVLCVCVYVCVCPLPSSLGFIWRVFCTCVFTGVSFLLSGARLAGKLSASIPTIGWLR